ncbi:MAG: hydrogenase [Deltaproteobacteria bacterium]|jgi:nitrogenase molybdenum-iron protein beta chain|nr:hydrogenase [Deltaproteobacteria bacterium]
MGCEKVIERPRSVCALGGQQTVVGIKGAAPIVHAGPGCAAKIGEALTGQAGFQGPGPLGGPTIASTNLSESEVVFGGEEKLRQTLEGALKVLKADIFVILTGCVPDIVGDDSLALAADFREAGHNVVAVETGGFKGNGYYGHEEVLSALIKQILIPKAGRNKKARPRNKKIPLINVFSSIPYQNPFWRGDLRAIKELGALLGIHVNLLFGPDSGGLAEWLTVPEADLNVVISPWVGLSAAKLLNEAFGTPWLYWPVPPVGAMESSLFLTSLGHSLGLPQKRIRLATNWGEDRAHQYLEAITEFLTESRNGLPQTFHVVADSAYALGLSKFLVNEMGFTQGLTFLTDDPPEHLRAQIAKPFGEFDGPAISPIFESDGGFMDRELDLALKQDNEAVMLASSWEKSLAKEHGAYLVAVSLPIWDRLVINRHYLGYEGGLNLLEDLYQSVLAKVH